MNVPAALAGFDPARPFRTDFTRPLEIVAPIRRVEAPRSQRDQHKMRLWEGECAWCGEDFSRMVRAAVTPENEPKTCSLQCAQFRRHARERGR